MFLNSYVAYMVVDGLMAGQPTPRNVPPSEIRV